MDVKFISKTKDALEVEVGEDEGFINALKEKLLQDRNIEMAYYMIGHPLTDKPKLFIKMKKGSSEEALKKAVRAYIKEIADFEKLLFEK